MKKILTMMAVLVMVNTADVSAQGFLKKLKKKAEAAVGLKESNNEKEYTQEEEITTEETNITNTTIAQGSDAVPKRKTSTVTWDGVITPSQASTSEALLRELPPLPSAEKMARSTMEERDAYTKKIAAVTTRAEQLLKNSTGCSDEEMEALRNKWENKVQNLFGLTKKEMEILHDENASEAQKEPIRQKIKTKMLGGNTDFSEMERFEKMSEKEQEAYIRSHPEFIQKMQSMAANSRNFRKQVDQMSGAGYQMRLGQLCTNYAKKMQQEENHNYDAIIRKYNGKLQNYYDDICATDDQNKIETLYNEADQLLYNYRLEAAKEYRASLQRRINEAKKFAAEFTKIMQEAINKGDIPECALGRSDLNMVITVANLLDEAYKDLPKLKAQPVCMETVYELGKEWQFCSWECEGYVGSISDFRTPGDRWPLLASHCTDNGDCEYGIVERGKFRTISEEELDQLNKQADLRQKNKGKSTQKPPYGVYKSRNGKRVVAYSQTGELMINGMTTYAPTAFTASNDRLEWITFIDNKIVKCTYKL